MARFFHNIPVMDWIVFLDIAHVWRIEMIKTRNTPGNSIAN